MSISDVTQSADRIITQTQSHPQHSDQSPIPAQSTRNAQRSSPLGSRLRERLVPKDKESDSQFLPVNAITELITEESVKDELKSHPCKKASNHASDWAPQIVAPCHHSNTGEAKTGRKKIFGLLSMILRVDLIEGFIGSKCDCDLPFGKEDWPLGDAKTDQPCAYEFLRGELLEHEIETLMDKQWLFLVPVFRREDANQPIPDLPTSTIFPFYEVETTRSLRYGHSSTVRKVKFHSAHYVDGEAQSIPRSRVASSSTEPDSSNMELCAIKELHRYTDDEYEYEGQYADICKKEVRNLLQVRNIAQDYLIELLFAYIHKGIYHLVFPWANGNLRTFWKEVYPDPAIPVRDESLAQWVFRQSYRLARGLKLIHGCETGEIGEVLANYGTHGDLKPENILWFEGPQGPGDSSSLGHFRISDFGGTQFHTVVSKSRGNWDDVQVTPTYEAPELGTYEKLAQSYDIWSLGCVLSEFLTWHLQGWQGVDDFSKSRAADNDPNLDSATAKGDYFLRRHEKLRNDSWNQNNNYKNWPQDRFFYRELPETCNSLARSKRSVQNHFNELYQHPTCSQASADLLKLIEDCLLRVNKTNRISITEVVERLERMESKGQTNIGYWTDPPKTKVRANTGLSDLPERRPSTRPKSVQSSVNHQPTNRNSEVPSNSEGSGSPEQPSHMFESPVSSRPSSRVSMVVVDLGQKPHAERLPLHTHDAELPAISEDPSQKQVTDSPEIPHSNEPVFTDGAQRSELQPDVEPPTASQGLRETEDTSASPDNNNQHADKRFLTPSGEHDAQGNRSCYSSSQNSGNQNSDMEKSRGSQDQEAQEQEAQDQRTVPAIEEPQTEDTRSPLNNRPRVQHYVQKIKKKVKLWVQVFRKQRNRSR
ncbi:hypothetical protein PG996_000101 [Apiospora saccharicola]|uniref:Protein kinase domain-containing protein n=1 Tax=Apiospora saccharicola TaxID=335842 RepID=A0ABR1WFS1_9PEZI